MTYVPRSGANLPNDYYKPEVWSAKLQKKWYADSLIARMTNNDWEEEIKRAGQVVHIRKRADAQVRPYTINQPIEWQALTDDKITFTIDYAYAAAMKMDTIDLAQMDIPVMNEYVDEIAKRQMNKEDEILFGSVYSSAYTVVTDSAACSPLASGNDAYIMARLSQLRMNLNKLFVPQEGRFVIVPPEVEDVIVRSDAARYDVSGDKNRAMREGEFGFKALGFDIMVSTFITGAGTSGSPFNCIAGTRDAISFARQVVDTEVGIPLQDYFGKGIKSLNVFGFKATAPKALIHWKARTS